MGMRKMFKVGYTQGVFDMFHVGHLNLINRAKEQCERLMVGVNSDVLVQNYKHKMPVIPERERIEIIRNMKAVDRAEIVETLDKVELWKQYHFEVVFIGDDWKGNERWNRTEEELSFHNVSVVYLPYTPNISSSALVGEIQNRVE